MNQALANQTVADKSVTNQPAADQAAANQSAANHAEAQSKVIAQLIEFVSSEVLLVRDEIGPDTDLLLTGAVDSLGVIRITQWMEDELNISVDPGDVTLENFQTVSSMAAYVATRPAV